MIVTVTANPALDVTYRVGELATGEVNRVHAVHTRAGGKGVNVARVLAALGEPVSMVAPVGGDSGRRFAADASTANLPAVLVPIAGETRRTVVVVDDAGRATGLHEPGPPISAGDWLTLAGRVAAEAARADVVVLSGSLPPGAPADGYARLATAAADAGATVLLDAGGADLRGGVCAQVAIAKPNAEELRQASGTPDPLAGARALRAGGAGAVVVSLGAEGMLAVTADGDWRAAAPRVPRGNPTGAGDAVVAALARGLVAGSPWPARLREAAALSAAAVAVPVAGEVEPARYRDLLGRVWVEPV